MATQKTPPDGDVFYTAMPLRWSHGTVTFCAAPTPEAALETVPLKGPAPICIEKRRRVEHDAAHSLLLERLPTPRTPRRSAR
jgi:hypothetical protein